MLQLPPEVLHLVATFLEQSTLSALLQVCRHFRVVFQPRLYQSVTIDNCTLQQWRSLISAPITNDSLSRTQKFSIEFLPDLSDSSKPMPILDVLITILKAMPNLRSFTACYFLVGLMQTPGSLDTTTVCDQLMELLNLEDLCLYCDSNWIHKFKWRLPPFTNLKSLALHRLDERPYGDISDVAEILLASPKLKSLGLSCRYEAGLDNDLLFGIIRYYHEKSVERGLLCTLQLRQLHLGIGTMPWEHPSCPDDHDYLSRLTNLDFLETLRLDNMHLHLDGIDVAVPFVPIVPELFSRAVRLKCIIVERFGPDILSLVRIVHEAQMSQSSHTSLSSLQVLEYGESLHFEGDEPESGGINGYSGDPIFSVPLSEAGYSWRRLCYSGFPYNRDPQRAAYSLDLLRFVAKCSELEELMIPIHNRAEMEFLKMQVLPKLPHLRLLHLPWGNLGKGFLSELECPRPNPYHFRRFSEEEKAETIQKNKDIDRELEKQRLGIVHDLFECHLGLRSELPHMAPLAHVAINTDVYARVFIPPMTGDRDNREAEISSSVGTRDTDPYLLSDGSKIVRLPREEARTLGIVEILLMKDILWIS
ncbi:hypothetical protein BJX64DRAFT_293272 [Aspergillus heterothallicus]